jgi:hypothetical protein
VRKKRGDEGNWVRGACGVDDCVCAQAILLQLQGHVAGRDPRPAISWAREVGPGVGALARNPALRGAEASLRSHIADNLPRYVGQACKSLGRLGVASSLSRAGRPHTIVKNRMGAASYGDVPYWVH